MGGAHGKALLSVGQCAVDGVEEAGVQLQRVEHLGELGREQWIRE